MQQTSYKEPRPQEVDFFVRMMKGHSKVASLSQINDNRMIWEVKRVQGDSLRAVLTRDYTLGLAAILELQCDFPSAEYFVTVFAYGSCTDEVKAYAAKNSIGVFSIGDFMGALNWDNPKDYVRKKESGEK